MLEKERLERELEHLKKAYRTGIIDDDEFEIAKNKIAVKMAKYTEAQTKYEESKKAISDMLDKKEEPEITEVYSDDSYVQIFDESVSEKEVNSIEDKTEKDAQNKEDKPTQKKDEGEWPTYDSMIIKKKKEDEEMYKSEDEESRNNKEEKQKEDEVSEDEEKQKDDNDLYDKEESNTNNKAEKKRKEFAKKWNIEKPSHRKKEEKEIKKKALYKDKREKKEEKGIDSEEKTIGKGLRIIFLIGLIIVFAFVAIKIYTNYFKEPAPIIPMEKNLSNANSTAIVEFYYSYSCKPCYESFKTLQEIKKVYKNKVSIIYLHFPLDVENDIMMDNAADCAAEQNAFFEYSEQLFKAKKPLTTENLITLTELTGLIDENQFRICLENKTKRTQIAEQYKILIEQGQIENLPTIKINKAAIAGAKPLEFYEAIIDTEIEIKNKSATSEIIINSSEAANTTKIVIELNNTNIIKIEDKNNTSTLNIIADNTSASALSDNKTINKLNFVIE